MINFKSTFKDILILYIKFKRSQGYSYKDENCFNLKAFDKLLYQEKMTEITIEVINTFCTKKNTEKNITTYHRQCFCKDVCLFIKNNGFPNTALFNNKYIKFNESNLQYIYTDEEISKIFKYINTVKYTHKTDKYFNENLKVLISLFYTTGIRRSEGFKLKFEDVNHKEKSIKIMNSKKNISRIIPLSNSMYELLNEHIEKFKDINNEYVFLKESGSLYNCNFRTLYVKILEKLNIKNLEGKTPRLHDLRFTFAVTALNNMANAGYDLYTTLPILQTYLGHTKIQSTEYYLKYTDKARENIVNNLIDFNADLFGGDSSE